MGEHYFEAGNIYLATYLVSHGCEMKGLSGSGRQKRILFDNAEKTRKLADKFFNNSKEEQLFQCYRKVKDFIFQNGA
jgi:hypothetical protein